MSSVASASKIIEVVIAATMVGDDGLSAGGSTPSRSSCAPPRRLVDSASRGTDDRDIIGTIPKGDS
jgi:hypothetical protein